MIEMFKENIAASKNILPKCGLVLFLMLSDNCINGSGNVIAKIYFAKVETDGSRLFTL